MKITIIGLGLIGGSIGLGLKNSAVEAKIIGVPRRKETMQEAIERGAVDEAIMDPRAGVAGADMVFICTPINRIIPLLREIAPGLKQGGIVTDVGSSKAEIVFRAEKIMPKGTYFVGGHPMAGKEKVKLAEAEAGLFKNKIYALTTTPKTSREALEKVKKVVGWLGGSVVELDPKLHDLVVAGISHMPLAVAAALVNTVKEVKKGKDEIRRFAASGFRDATRIASGDPALGVDMFTTNKKAVLKMLSAFKKSLFRIEKLIKKGDVDKLGKELGQAKNFRDSIYG